MPERQAVKIRSSKAKGSNKALNLSHGVSIAELTGGVRVYKVAAALLLGGGNTYVAGWLAGAFRNVGKNHIADEILITMGSAGFLVNDACNSLSIEGYQVSSELIERVRSGKWSPETLTQDRSLRQA